MPSAAVTSFDCSSALRKPIKTAGEKRRKKKRKILKGLEKLGLPSDGSSLGEISEAEWELFLDRNDSLPLRFKQEKLSPEQ